jgi:acyl dehydratase
LKQKYYIYQPAYINQNITATVEVSRIRQEKWLVNLATTCMDQYGEIILTGDALVQVEDVPEAKD